MDRRLDRELRRIARTVPEPDDYFRGIRRRSDPAPDNLLLFVRRSPEDLWPPGGASSFHHRWVLITALVGSGTLQMDSQAFRLSPGTALLIPPLHLHGYRRISARILWLFATFEWPGHQAAQASWSGGRKMPLAALGHLAQLAKVVREPNGGPLAAAHLHEILHSLGRVRADRSPPRRSLLEKVQSDVERHPFARIPDRGMRLGISESHIRALFRQETGMSIGRYVRESRIRKVAIRMRDERLSVSQAADAAGYPDISSFSRAFRRTFGHPPSEILRANGVPLRD